MMPTRTESTADGGGINWDAAWRHHVRWLRTVIASRVGSPGDVDDVLQQVGLAAATAAARPHSIADLAPWLYRVAVRQCLLHRRSAGRRRKLLAAAHSRPDDGSDGSSQEPLEWLLREERISLAGQALAALPDVDRQLLLLKHTENWTYRQLAEHLGVSVDSVEHRLLQARQRLRRQLSRTGFVEAGK